MYLVVFTFDRPPKEVVTGKPVFLLNSPEDRQELMNQQVAALGLSDTHFTNVKGFKSIWILRAEGPLSIIISMR